MARRHWLWGCALLAAGTVGCSYDFNALFTDAGPGDTDAGTDDAGAPVNGSCSCNCANGSSCDCTSKDCSASCDGGVCTTTCDLPLGCSATCAAGSTCNLYCSAQAEQPQPQYCNLNCGDDASAVPCREQVFACNPTPGQCGPVK